MSAEARKNDAAIFETHRRALVALAYRMLGDVGRAEDMVQEAWLRWQRHDAEIETPKAFLITVVTRLCLNELESARARREESRDNRLPEPVHFEEDGGERLEELEQVSMAFLVVLQRLTPAERAVLLLHDVFDFPHLEIAGLVGKNEVATRKLLERARENVARGRRSLTASREEHQRLLAAFLAASRAGDAKTLLGLLAPDADMTTDGGPEGRVVGRLRNLERPLVGAARVAAFVVSAAGGAPNLVIEIHELNGRPGIVFYREEKPFAALLLAVADGKIEHVFFHADENRLGHLGPRRQS